MTESEWTPLPLAGLRAVLEAPPAHLGPRAPQVQRGANAPTTLGHRTGVRLWLGPACRLGLSLGLEPALGLDFGLGLSLGPSRGADL